MEEDAGKLIHKGNYSLVNFNRTGIPLLEIVSEPDIKSPQQAYDYLNTLKLIIQYIGASSCDMEKGYLRCDANISLRPRGDKKLGTKIELKNMNSFRGVRDALSYEVKRQQKILAQGGKLYQETRLWDNDKNKSIVMRTKEQAHDYRYFPEPDLVDYVVDKEMIEKEKELIGELPLKKKEKFVNNYQLKDKDADVLISSHYLADLFERTVDAIKKPKEVSKWIIGPFLESVNAKSISWQDIALDAKRFAQIIEYFLEGKINNLAAKKVLLSALDSDKDIDSIIKEQGLKQVSGEEELMQYVQEVISEHTKPVNDFLNGKEKAIMFLVGQVMRKTRGKANPKVVKGLLEREIRKK
jgi:aspartyl-tRNA(Asn)/glutamyl-tRNA(Gln) amidotransferase subunit B